MLQLHYFAAFSANTAFHLAAVVCIFLLCNLHVCHVTLQGVYVFYLQLLTDMLHLCVYLVFFVIVFTNYGLPLHLVSLLMPFKVVLRCALTPVHHLFLCSNSLTMLSQVRDLYWTFRNFRNRVVDFLRYRWRNCSCCCAPVLAVQVSLPFCCVVPWFCVYI